MANIKIYSDTQKGCIFFDNSTVEPKFLGTVVAEIKADETDRIHIFRTDRRRQDGVTFRTIFRRLNPNRVENRDGQTLVGTLGYTVAQVVDYINQQASNFQAETSTDLTDEVINFRLDQTTTSIIMDNGAAFGVNTIKAVADSDGTIHIHAVGAGVPNDEQEANEQKHFEKLIHTNVRINGEAVPGGLNDVVNSLNELFTVGPFEAVVIADPHSTLIADVDGVTTTYNLVGIHAVDPISNSIFGATQNTNYAGLKTVDTIDQAGEYFTFDIRGEGQLGFGLIHTDDSYADGYYTGNATYANPDNFATFNSQHAGFQFSHHFHPTPNGSWTNYGANTGFVRGPGWYNWESQDEWLAGDPVKVRCGIDENGFIYVSTLQDDGTTWVMHARSSYVVPEGSEYHLGIKIGRNSSFVESVPKVHLLEEDAPTMYFRYIESPDNSFVFPLFATEEEANYWNLVKGGTGTSHTHTYADDPTNTTWYMPDTYNNMDGYHTNPNDANTPATNFFEGNPITWTEITSLTNADLTPSQFTNANLTYEEGTAVNIQLQPADTTYSTSVDISPSGSGLVFNSSSKMLQGTLADVGTDTTYTITVTRANSYGSSVGSFTITATDVTPVTSHTTPWTKAIRFSGGAERMEQVNDDYFRCPIKMGNINNNVAGPALAGKTSNATDARPWVTAIVFKLHSYNDNQHIWNVGEGSQSNQDNIYLRRDANRNLWFGWGRGSETNECQIATGLGTTGWNAVYIAHTGERLGSGHTAAEIADCFDIRYTSGGSSWAIGSNLSTSANWTAGSFGYRMNRQLTGDFTIGGRGSNRSFRGWIASMVVATLKRDQVMPNDAEIAEMITDPQDWFNNYRNGNTYRLPWEGGTRTNQRRNDGSSAYGTQIWLMGDGPNDSYSNMIRNWVFPTDQNYTKMNMISMVSNDIENVSINGLT